MLTHRKKVLRIAIELQASTEQRPHKISYCLDPDSLPGGKAGAVQLMGQLQKVLKDDHGTNAKVICSGGFGEGQVQHFTGRGKEASHKGKREWRE